MSKLQTRFLVLAACLALPLCAPAAPLSQPETLTVFLKGRSEALESMRAEVARLMEPTGLAVAWKGMTDRRPGEDFARLVIVELRGNCSANSSSAGAASPADIRSLASTAVVDGRVLPFARVECDALRRVLASSASNPLLLGRAMARVIAHELYHMLAQTKSHSSAGVSKPCFRVSDLLSDQFAFDSVTVAQLRPAETVAAVEEPLSEESGR